MKIPIRILLLLVGLSMAVSGRGSAETLPQYRPALLGHHQRSLVNLIDTQRLMKQGQGDAILMFETGVSKTGKAYDSRTYRESPGAEKLRREVMSKLDMAQFEQGVYNHAYVSAYVQGTVDFFIRDGKPHLRIYLHQEEESLKTGQDFVAPQFTFVPGNTQFRGFYSPDRASGQKGVAAVQVDVDANGYVKGTSLKYEHPPGKGFGKETVAGLLDARFIPGFRNGKPVACRFTWTMIYVGPGRQMRTG